MASPSNPVEESLLLCLNDPNNPQHFSHIKQLLSNEEQCDELLKSFQHISVPDIRNLLAVLLRQAVCRGQFWGSLSNFSKSWFKSTVFELLLIEPDNSVKKSLLSLVASTAKRINKSGNGWDELLTFLNATSADAKYHLLLLQLLSAVAEECADIFEPIISDVLTLVASCLVSPEKNIAHEAIKCLSHVLVLVTSAQQHQIESLVPTIVAAIRESLSVDESIAEDLFTIFDAFFDHDLDFIGIHISLVSDFLLEVASNETLGWDIKSSALSSLSELLSLRRKPNVKRRLLPTVLDKCFTILTSEGYETDFEDKFFGSHPAASSLKVLHSIAISMSPKAYMPSLRHKLTGCIKNADPVFRQAGFVALGTICEGCGEHLQEHYLGEVNGFIQAGLKDTSSSVRQSVVYCLEQICENVPDISKHAHVILPTLLLLLESSCAEQNADLSKRCLTTLGSFVGNCAAAAASSSLESHLLLLFERTCAIVKNASTPPSVREAALELLGILGNMFPPELNKLFNKVLHEVIEPSLANVQEPKDDEDMLKLEAQALDTLDMFADSVDFTLLVPVIVPLLKLCHSVLKSAKDPDLRSGALELCGTLFQRAQHGEVLSECSQFLEPLISICGQSISSKDTFTHSQQTSESFSLFAPDQPDDLHADVIESIGSVNIPHISEIATACRLIGKLALCFKEAFYSYWDMCYEMVVSLSGLPSDSTKEAAIDASCSLFCALPATVEDSIQSQKFSQLIGEFFTELISTASLTPEQTASMCNLDATRRMLSECEFLQNLIKSQQCGQWIETVKKLIVEALKGQLTCQLNEDAEEEEDESEQDKQLIEYAGELLPALAGVLPQMEFVQFFASVLPTLLKRTKPGAEVSERSFVCGCVAEVVSCLRDGACTPFLHPLSRLFLHHIRDEDGEVRNNAAFGLGELAEHGGPDFDKSGKAEEAIKLLLTASAKETFPGARDNIAGALAKFVLHQADALTRQHAEKKVLQSLIELSPPEEDFGEFKHVIDALTMYTSTAPNLITAPVCELVLEKITKGVVDYVAHHQGKLDVEIEASASELFKSLSVSKPEIISKFFEYLPEIQRTVLTKLLESGISNGLAAAGDATAL